MEDRLVKFAHIVEAGSFTKAAASLRISQPALTTAVKKLERELHAELVVRSGRGLQLTAAGEIAYRTARSLVTQTKNLEVRLREVTEEKPSVNIGMIDSIADLLFVHGSYLQQLEQNAKSALTVDNSARLIDALERSELDLALIVERGRLPSRLVTKKIASEPLIMVVHADGRSDIQKELAAGQLHRVMSYNHDSQTYLIILEHFAKLGVQLQPAFYSTSPEIMLQLVLTGRGAAVLPYLLVKPHLEAGTLQLVKLKGKPIVVKRTILQVQRSGAIQPLLTTKLLAHTKQQLEMLDLQVKRI